MIASLRGELQEVTGGRAVVAVGPVMVELLVPAADEPALEGAVGAERVFYTHLYLEGDAAGGNMTPRLLGFLSAADRAFFQKFVTVKGIGPRKALRAMVIPAGELAAAIEAKDARTLQTLPAVGKRLAETIIAELAGKVGEHVTVSLEPTAPVRPRRSAIEEDAIGTLMALGERRSEAEKLLEQARAAGTDVAAASVNELVKAMLNLRAKGGGQSGGKRG